MKPELTDEEICSVLLPFGFRPSDDQIGMIREYIRLLLKWNRIMSLTTVQDPAEIVARHFGESIFASCAIPVENCRLADVGSGAGFPGLALKIALPKLRVSLIESNTKKCAFLSEVARSLRLVDVEVIPKRFDEVGGSQDFADFVAARALGGFPALLHWAMKILAPRGNVILWVGLDDVNTIGRTAGWLWQPAIKIPESQRRYLLVGRPHR